MKYFILGFLISIFLIHDGISMKLSKDKNLQLAEKKLDEVESLYALVQHEASIKVGREILRLLPNINKSNEKCIFKAYLNLATNYFMLYKSDSTDYFFSKANNLLRQSPNLTAEIPNYVANHWDHQGMFYARKANYTQAVHYIQKGLLVCKEYHLNQYELPFLNNLANTYDWMGDYQNAFLIYQKIQKIGVPKHYNGLQTLTSMGWNALRRKEYVQAEAFFQKSLTMYQFLVNENLLVHNELDKMLIKFDLGVCYSLSTSFEKSNLYLDKVIDFYGKSKIKKDKYLSLAHLQKAKNLYALGVKQQALQEVQKGLQALVLEFNSDVVADNPSLSQTILDKKSLFQLLTFKGEILSNTYEKKHQEAILEKSVRCFYLAVLLAEKYRKAIDYQEDKLRFNQDNKLVFEKAIHLGYKFYQLQPNIVNANLFLRIMESTKAIALNDKIAIDKVKISTKAMPIQDEEQKELRYNAGLKQAMLDNKVNVKSLDSLRKLLTDSELKLYELNNKLASYMPHRNSQYFNADISIKEIVANLSSESAYISYTITSDFKIFVLAANHQKVIIKKLEIGSDFIHQTQKLIIALRENPTLFAYQGSAEATALYKILINPIEQVLVGTKCLIISRDGILNYLPFEVLELGKNKNDYLIRYFAISYQYNALTYLLKQELKTNVNPKLLTITPFIKQQIIANDTLMALPASSKTDNDDVLLDVKASKNRFVQLSDKYDVFHLKCHSVSDPNKYADSYIYFNPSSSPWKLGFHEIMTLPMKQCQLLILGSCNSGNGHIEPQEGVMSLCYAFYKAGCKAVLSAQWQAHDRSSEFITSRFYNYLKEGKPKDIALQKAKIDFLNEPLGNELNHPFYWANLTITGNISPIVTNNFSKIYLFAGIISCLLLILFLLKKYATKPRIS
ncbi:CHAT domain-containing tetratricopeptide repeat protein [Arcicella sp. DC2W]|uniref:CHAT domain-containing tetratricopeptide repeat protein n=1 Tax=Arcicella gelida TaxID=2984195 RepID=A0ABU5S7E5_9BACT|nr:CHAT domain-containing tetratricopeptide repeat protein [Arcicella sp. DC2W]MEA5404389.1 CHAT domain-containing tetratricopeptide repeat protein [Arcicella sp. DC2W]